MSQIREINVVMMEAAMLEIILLREIAERSRPNWGRSIAPAYSGQWQHSRERARVLCESLKGRGFDEPQRQFDAVLQQVDSQWRH